jgi:ubiquitin C
MKIFVMTMDGTTSPQVADHIDKIGKRIQLEVQPNDTVEDIRKLIENMEGTSPGENERGSMLTRLENQNLKFAGKSLIRGTMADYNIQKESVVHMVTRFKGGF